MKNLTVVIPTYNSAQGLAATIEALLPHIAPQQIVVCDAASTDQTREIANQLGVRLAICPQPGRGPQLAYGASQATTPWMMFVHSDTVLGSGWAQEVGDFVAQADSKEHVGYFRFCLDDDSIKARWLELGVAMRCGLWGMPYGDQGLLISRALYDQVGGYRPLRMMEDVDIIARLGRHRQRALRTFARTSAVRYRRGYLRRITRNMYCLWLYYRGVSPDQIAQIYEGKAKKSNSAYNNSRTRQTQ